MSRIATIEAIPYCIDYAKTLRFASGHVDKADHILLRIRTEDGVEGIADAPPRPYTYGETQRSIRAIIDEVLAPQLIGARADDTARTNEVLKRTVNNNVAKAAIDIALWDIKAKTYGTTLTRMLGGFTDRVQVAHMVGFAETRDVLAEVDSLIERYGITAFKVKVGRPDVQQDIDVCRALREKFGDDITMYADGNRGWNARESAFVMDALSELGLAFVEELNPASEAFGRRGIVRAACMPFVVDESAPTPSDVWRSLQDGDGTAVSIKTARTGFTDSLRIWGLCSSAGVDTVMGNQIDTQVGSLATVAFGAAFRETSAMAAEVSNFLDMEDDLQAEPLQIRDGCALVPDRPGYGAEIDEDKLAFYRTDS
ncbi:mandelate racemase/muconate lactonizing enzyme family protein [Nocardiopsis salina]|uniref:mandelate racemase/muconate lactonizing enzyme family protein n=1 Tax=Nocardiopsis salina TaxID=245836 RepID=UPI00034A3482|nr:enolase C-terminal domain-like protein [Nocardiopsis salina]